jgi:hypothetical protein
MRRSNPDFASSRPPGLLRFARNDGERDIPQPPRGARRTRAMPTRDPRKQRAQGMPGAGRNPWPACRQKAGGSHHRSSRTSGIPCAMGLRFIRDLPGERLFLPPSSARCWKHHANLAPASRRQDHTTSPSAKASHQHRDGEPPIALAQGRSTSLVVTTSSRPPHPAPRVVTTARTPLVSRRDGWIRHLIWGWSQENFL